MDLVVQLPDVSQEFSYTGEWRVPLPLEFFLQLDGKVWVATFDPPSGCFHILKGPKNKRIDLLEERIRLYSTAHWKSEEAKQTSLNDLIYTLGRVMSSSGE